LVENPKNPHCVNPGFLDLNADDSYLCGMFIKAVQKHKAGTNENPMYCRLCESYRDSLGKTRQRMIIALGYMEDLRRRSDRQELYRCLNDMVLRNQHPTCDNLYIIELANHYYQKTVESNRLTPVRETEVSSQKEAERRKQEEVTVKLSTLTNVSPGETGAEHVAQTCLERLKIDRFLATKDWSANEIMTAKLQIAARSIYPCSEYRTVRILRENSALCEMLGLKAEEITKDKLYRCACRLYKLHHELENWLSNQVRNLLSQENKILLFDLSNTCFEGRMKNSSIAKFGRSKEKRTDCKQAVLAAAVNTQGLLVRTRIYEGNRADCTAMQEVLKSIEHKGLPPESEKKIIVMDADISTKENLKYLKKNNYHYITVARSSNVRYEDTGCEARELHDNKGQIIRLKGVKAVSGDDTLLPVESRAKAFKEESMYERSCDLFEDGLNAITAGIHKKGGTKKRDRVNERTGRLKQRFSSVWSHYDISIEYDRKETVTSIEWKKKPGKQEEAESRHGTYILQTDPDETDEKTVRDFYNVIRTVEETFRIFKTDLDIRPIYHKTDDGTKAHLHPAILACWIVSCSRYQLKKAGISHEWTETVRILSTHKTVSTGMQQTSDDWIEIRQCTLPEASAAAIYTALHIKEEPCRRRKFVWHPEKPPEKTPADSLAINSG
jgi:transposase